jgi:hypothetical protein
MIRVLRHGNTISVQNPVTGEWNNMINVTFIEEGRGGADQGMTETTAFLANITGDSGVGLNQARIHTHPIMADKIGLFPVGAEFPGHINRGLYSTPQIQQQTNRDARMIDGRPTYFKTWISPQPEDDKDFRISLDVLVAAKPSEVFGAVVGAARVEVIQTAQQAGRAANPAGLTTSHTTETIPPGADFTEGRPANVGDRTKSSPLGGEDQDQRSAEQRDFPK